VGTWILCWLPEGALAFFFCDSFVAPPA
jgi:hypothetical protein